MEQQRELQQWHGTTQRTVAPVHQHHEREAQVQHVRRELRDLSRMEVVLQVYQQQRAIPAATSAQRTQPSR
jgi:hypothetical protein